MNTRGRCWVLLILLVLAPAAARGADAKPPEHEPRRIGKVLVHLDERCIDVPGAFCLDRGILDYGLIAPGSGKEYESVIAIDGKSSEIHAGLLALGLRPGPVDKAAMQGGRRVPDESAAAEKVPPGARVQITVRFEEGKKAVREAPLETFLINRATGKPARGLVWIFTGSRFGKMTDGGDAYLADVYGVVASLWYDGVCTLNLAEAKGNPYRGKALGFEINPKTVPKPGARVTVRFRPIEPKTEEKEK